ncbi:MAG: MarC family NAAT transporter [Cyanobium sp. Prado107]|jgi:multiple antibiotic resistance protein|nr:MarC family NAAT transporter [Cyanobium sp. Prado107]
MNEWIGLFGAAFTGLFPIVNPFAAAPVFLSITANNSEGRRNQQLRQACLYALTILVVTFLAGRWVFELFGISLPGIRIAGGVLVALVGLRMLYPRREALQTPEEEREALEKEDVSFSPLAMPLLAGPGAIAVMLTLTTQAERTAGRLAVLAGATAVIGISYLMLRASEVLVPLLGVNGVNAITKVMGFLLLCVGVQFLVTGVEDMVLDPVFLRQFREAWRQAGGAG